MYLSVTQRSKTVSILGGIPTSRVTQTLLISIFPSRSVQVNPIQSTSSTTIVSSQKGHPQDGILVDPTHHERLFRFGVSHPNRKTNRVIKWQLGTASQHPWTLFSSKALLIRSGNQSTTLDSMLVVQPVSMTNCIRLPSIQLSRK